MGYRDDADDKGACPLTMVLKIAISLLILPVTGFFFNLRIIVCLVGTSVGLAVFLLLERRPRRKSSFPLKSILAGCACEGFAMILMGNLLVVGPLLVVTSSSVSEASGYSLKTAFSADVKTMSVILPCANEGMYAVKTVRSLGERTPKDVLVEIIVVDDGSTPALEEYFHEHGQDVLDKYTVKFVRHETFTGLINAKKQGGDRATGDVLTFLDCHVLPRDYGQGKSWTDGIMSRIAGNYKRIVVPSITDLDADKWDEIGRPNGIAKCYLSLDVDFRWFDSEDDFVPIMSGGLLAMSRQWWIDTGGYDTGMIGWGGENIDQSLRAWLCGGEIVHATDSHVAHMWRTNDKPQTKAKYTVPEGSVNTNRYRAALAWFDDYIEKVQEFGIFSKFAPPASVPLPNIDSILEVRNRLQCQPFQWFIDRFSKIYFDAAVLPTEVFRVRDANTNLCLARRNSGNRDSHNVVAASCSTEDPMQLWHRSNREGEECCSGLRSYDSMYCLSGGGGGAASATECNTYGKNNQQKVSVTPAGEVKFSQSGTCISLAASVSDVIVQSPCDQQEFLREFIKRPVENNDGLGSGSYKIFEATTGLCWTAFSPVGGDEDPGSIELAPCDSRSVAQHFKIVDSFIPGYVKIINWENFCLDSADGKRILSYQCYDDSAANEKQVFVFDEPTRTIRNRHHPTCVALPDSRVKLTATTVPVSVSGCITWNNVIKSEQKFTKVPSLRDPSKGNLLKVDQWCLSGKPGQDPVVMVHCPTTPAEETDWMLWSFETLSRLRNRAANKCLDGNDHKTPILYPCYSSDNDNQEWTDPGTEGGKIKNARAQMCLDYHPQKERSASVSNNCQTGARWEMFEPRETTEMRIYKRTKERLSAPVHG